MSFEIPDGLTDLLQDFTVEVLRKRPSDILAFASQYFDELVEKRATEQNQKQLAAQTTVSYFCLLISLNFADYSFFYFQSPQITTTTKRRRRRTMKWEI